MNQKEYRYTPEKRDSGEKLLCFLLLIAALIAFYLSNTFLSFRLAGQVLAVILLFFFIQITTRYLLTQVDYLLQGNDFYIITRQGKKEKRVGSLEITPDCKFFTQKEWEKEKKNHPAGHRFSYCQNLFSAEKHYLICPEGENRFLVLCFEPDSILSKQIKEYIKPSEEDTL